MMAKMETLVRAGLGEFNAVVPFAGSGGVFLERDEAVYTRI